MNIATAKCPNCGATLKVNSEAKDGVCQFCGTPFFTKDAINNYNTTVINNTTHNTTHNTTNNTYLHADNITIQNGNFTNLLAAGLVSWDAEDYSDAYDKFSRALELKPTDPKCSIYKSLCLAILNRNISGVTATYKRIFGNPNYPYRQELDFVKAQLANFNSILIAEVTVITNDFSPNCHDISSIETAWNALEDVLEARQLMVTIAEKVYLCDNGYKPDFIVLLKNLLDIYNRLTAGWKWVVSSELGLYPEEHHPLRDEFLKQRAALARRINGLEGVIYKAPVQNDNNKKTGRLFKILGIAGIGIMVGIGVILLVLNL